MENEIFNAKIENTDNPEEIARFIAEVLDSKKARDIKVLRVEDRTVIAEWFVICTGTSRTQIRALADEADYRLEPYGVNAIHTEGADSGVWVLKDYGSVILHVFSAQSRDFYKLEKLYDGASDGDKNITDTEE